MSRFSSLNRGARDPGMILPALLLLGKARAWCLQCRGDLPERFQHACLSRNKGDGSAGLEIIRGSSYSWQFLSKHSQKDIPQRQL